MKRWFFFSVFIIAAAAGAYALFRPAQVQEGKMELVSAKVIRGDLKLMVAASGVVTAYTEVEVKSKAGGEIIDFPFEEGDVLEKDAVAVKLDPDTEQSRVNQADADLKMAEARLEKAQVNRKDAELRQDRKKRLFDDGVISRQELDDAVIATERAKSDVKVAQAELIRMRESLREAKDRLKDTAIRAPLKGTIIKKYVEMGQVIASTLSSASEGTPLFTLADLDRLYVETMVDETDIGRINAGQEASITVDAYPGKTFRGKVLRIAPKGRVESTVTVFDVVVEVIDRERLMLKPMMTANVEILYDLRQSVLLVPAEAVRSRGEKTGVNRLGEGGLVWTPVSAGKSDGIVIEISGEIREGDSVEISKAERKTGRPGGLWNMGRKR